MTSTKLLRPLLYLEDPSRASHDVVTCASCGEQHSDYEASKAGWLVLRRLRLPEPGVLPEARDAGGPRPRLAAEPVDPAGRASGAEDAAAGHHRLLPDLQPSDCRAAARKARKLSILAAYFSHGVWWAASINRWHDQTGIAHIVNGGGTLCGARPFSMGGSYQSAVDTGAHECRRCCKIIDEVKSHAHATP